MIFDSISEPDTFLHKLRIRSRGAEVEVQEEGNDKCQKGHTQRDIPEKVFLFLVEEDEQSGSGQREKRDDTQYWKVHFKKLSKSR